MAKHACPLSAAFHPLIAMTNCIFFPGDLQPIAMSALDNLAPQIEGFQVQEERMCSKLLQLLTVLLVL